MARNDHSMVSEGLKKKPIQPKTPKTGLKMAQKWSKKRFKNQKFGYAKQTNNYSIALSLSIDKDHLKVIQVLNR